MSQRTLHLAPELELPRTAMLQRFAILGMSGAGKSNTGAVMAEQMYDAEVPWCVVDPKGDWWGLRSSRTGKRGALDVPIFGGERGDIPLYADGGKVMADAVARELSHSILDVSGFEKAEMLGFLIDFAERMYEVNKKPIVLILEEADEYIPQNKESPLEAKSVAKWSRIVKRGRTRGLLTVLIALRNSELAKSVLNFSDTVIAHRATAKLDRDAVKGWVEYAGESKELLDSLPTLDDGEAWVSSPQKLKVTKRVHFNRRSTFDSGATPDLDADREQVKLAAIDLGSIENRMKETIERAEEEDPEKLQAKVRELRATVSRLETETPEPGPPPEPEEIEKIIEVFPKDLRGQLGLILERIQGDVKELTLSVEDAIAEVDEADEKYEPGSDQNEVVKSPPQPDPAFGPPSSGDQNSQPALNDTPEPEPEEGDFGPLPKAARKFLEVLVQRSPVKLTRPQLATLAGYSAKSSTIPNNLTELRKRGLLQEQGGSLFPSKLGYALIGTPPTPQTPAEVRSQWKGSLPGGAAGCFFSALEEVYPGGLTRPGLAEKCGYSTNSSTIPNNLSVLRRNGLISEDNGTIRLVDHLFA